MVAVKEQETEAMGGATETVVDKLVVWTVATQAEACWVEEAKAVAR